MAFRVLVIPGPVVPSAGNAKSPEWRRNLSPKYENANAISPRRVKSHSHRGCTMKPEMAVAALLLGSLLGAAAPAFAKPPPGADLSLAPWYRAWHSPTPATRAARWPTVGRCSTAPWGIISRPSSTAAASAPMRRRHGFGCRRGMCCTGGTTRRGSRRVLV